MKDLRYSFYTPRDIGPANTAIPMSLDVSAFDSPTAISNKSDWLSPAVTSPSVVVAEAQIQREPSLSNNGSVAKATVSPRPNEIERFETVPIQSNGKKNVGYDKADEGDDALSVGVPDQLPDTDAFARDEHFKPTLFVLRPAMNGWSRRLSDDADMMTSGQGQGQSQGDNDSDLDSAYF